MNIQAKPFVLDKPYKVNDVIYADSIETSATLLPTDITANGAWPAGSNTDFFIKSDLIITTYLKRSSTAIAGFIDRTTFAKSGGTFNGATSRGVGIGVIFKNSGGTTLDTLGRLVPYGNIPTAAYRSIKFIIEQADIPEGTTQVLPVMLAGNVQSGTFYFKDINLKYLNKYFYCIKDNTSSASNKPAGTNGTDYWTKDFLWKPAFGAQFNFKVDVKSKKFQGGYQKNIIAGVNSMSLTLEYSFSNLTTRAAGAILHFLQQGVKMNESSFTADDEGNPLVSALISYFDLILPFPYKAQKVIASNYTHKQNYLNNHTIQATFVCDKETILNNVESYAGFNANLDSSSTFNLGAASVTLTKGEEYTFEGDSSLNTAGAAKPNIFLKGYFQGDVAAISDSIEVNFTPQEDYTIISDSETLEFILPFVNTNGLSRSSIFIKNVDNIKYYPYDKIRTCTFFPDLNFSINTSPLEDQQAFSNNYSLFYKKNINSNLMKLNLSFSKRSDGEAKALLYFLESHFGYLPFRFKVPENYNIKDENDSFKKNVSRTFYCYDWSHVYRFKNNHEISATFIEYGLPVNEN